MFHAGYYITAELKVKDASKADVAKAALSVLCQRTLTESGCTIFTLHQDPNQPARFLLWERFDDEAAFRVHFESPHTKEYVERDLTEVVQYFQTELA
ncbi:antibiotic biosynthesis monooxygenase [Polaromonas sp.]|uniref:putative quinol monooxygenase n=1 Tax=Polaromonas sp. TaxID=1869339 RepID=UPI00326576F9